MVFGACKSLIFYNISKKDEIGNCGSNNNVVKIEIYTTCCDIAHRQKYRFIHVTYHRECKIFITIL